jgi:hypothetical protein
MIFPFALGRSKSDISMVSETGPAKITATHGLPSVQLPFRSNAVLMIFCHCDPLDQ